MPKFIFFLMIAALGNTAYHLGQKSLHDVPHNPMLILGVYYFAALILCLLAMPLFGKAEMANAGELLTDWRVWVVAVGILLIELGFLLAYQAGGSPQWGGVAVNGVAALMLIPLSIFLFHEHFSWTRILGILLTLSGLYFLVKK